MKKPYTVLQQLRRVARGTVTPEAAERRLMGMFGTVLDAQYARARERLDSAQQDLAGVKQAVSTVDGLYQKLKAERQADQDTYKQAELFLLRVFLARPGETLAQAGDRYKLERQNMERELPLLRTEVGELRKKLLIEKVADGTSPAQRLASLDLKVGAAQAETRLHAERADRAERVVRAWARKLGFEDSRQMEWNAFDDMRAEQAPFVTKLMLERDGRGDAWRQVYCELGLRNDHVLTDEAVATKVRAKVQEMANSHITMGNFVRVLGTMGVLIECFGGSWRARWGTQVLRGKNGRWCDSKRSMNEATPYDSLAELAAAMDFAFHESR